MKIVVIGGSGLIGSKTVERLRNKGHQVVAASPNTGVDTITGKGLRDALVDRQVVIDLANSPVFEGEAVREFFETSGRNLLAAEAVAGVKHHVALSVVGVDRLLKSDYFRGKVAQEELIRRSEIPHTIVRSTQFFEFLGGIAQAGTIGDEVHVPPSRVQPIAADDVADKVTEFALAAPANGVVEIAGPTAARLCDLVSDYLEAIGDPRRVRMDRYARYFGVELDDHSLMPGATARLGPTGFDEWLARSRIASPARQTA